jgi:hypothetical protein
VHLDVSDAAIVFDLLAPVLWSDGYDDGDLEGFDDLVEFCAGYVRRDGDDLVFEEPPTWRDRKWSDECNHFYGSLGPWATGRVDVTGEDGERWSYVYADGAVNQSGTNGWDGTTSPPTDPPGTERVDTARTEGRGLRPTRPRREDLHGIALICGIADADAGVIWPDDDGLHVHVSRHRPTGDPLQRQLDRAADELERLTAGDPPPGLAEIVARIRSAVATVQILQDRPFDEAQWAWVEDVAAKLDAVASDGDGRVWWTDPEGIRHEFTVPVPEGRRPRRSG